MPERWFSRRVPWLVMLGSLGATLAVAGRFRHVHDERERARFDDAADEAVDTIRSRLDSYLALLHATRSFVDTWPELDYQRFHRYAESLRISERFPGLYALSWAERAGRDNLPQLEKRRRAEGAADFHVWPEPGDESFPVLYVEPEHNHQVLGFDILSEPLRKQTLDRARDSGEPAASDRLTVLKQISPEQPAAFLLQLAVYRGQPTTLEERRRQLRGVVQCGFRAGDLFTPLLASLGGSLSVRIADEGRVLHDSGAPAHPIFSAERQLAVAGRTWTLTFRSRPGFEAHTQNEVSYVLLTGLLFSLALFLVSRNQALARTAAEEHRAHLQLANRDARAAETTAQVQQQRLHDLFMRAPVAIAIQEGPSLVYTLANPSYRQFFGNRELVGKPLADVLPEVARLRQILTQVRGTGKPWEGREQIFKVDRGDGNWVEGYFNLICQPVFGGDGQVSGTITFGFEVTDLVRARNDKEALAGDLQAAVRARDTFLAIASHELRTPLTTLQLQSDGLTRSLGRPPVDHQKLRGRAEKIQTQAGRLNHLISDLLDVSRITAGRLVLDLQSFDLKALVEDALSRSEEALQRAGCAVVLSAEAPVVGRWDRQRLDQVMINLFANAAKYGAGKPVQIVVSGDGERARVVVRDQGIGIDPADQARIFERFERAVSERNFGGLGLGLWISEQIVSAHGGTIRVDSRPGEGSTFTVELPR